MDTVLKPDIVNSLRKLPVLPCDCVMVHSSLSSLGYVEGGADTVIDAFFETIGPDGTLVMPTLCQKDLERRFEIWDIASSPSDVGRITETFRLRSGVIRSDHATHSVAGLGPQALSITEGHRRASGRLGPWGPAAFGIGAPYDRLYELEAKIVLVGINSRFNTVVHYIEHLLVQSLLQESASELRESRAQDLRGWNQEGVWPWFDRLQLQERLREASLLKSEVCGKAKLLMSPVKETVDSALSWMQAAP